jgi:hypothetical protein
MDLGGRKAVALVERQRRADRREIESLVAEEVDLAQQPSVSRGQARGPYHDQDQHHEATACALHSAPTFQNRRRHRPSGRVSACCP